MDTPRRRLSNWAIAGIIAGVLALIGGALALMIRSTADAAWEAMEKRTREMIAEARARPTARPILRGIAEPGNAWADYQAAAKLMEAIQSKRMKVYAYVTRRPEADKTGVEKLIAPLGPAIELMRRGTRRAEADYPYAWERGGALDTPPLLLMQDLGMLAVTHARLMREGGLHRAAVELLLDTAHFGGDLRRNAVLISDMVGLAVISVALDELHNHLSASVSRGEEVAAIDRELEILDRSWADFATTLRNEGMVVQATFLANGGNFPADPPKLFDTWRYGFSQKLMAAEAGLRVSQYLEQSSRQESMPWADRLKAAEESKREFEKGTNPLTKNFGSGGILSSNAVRQRRAQLRMLRIAARFRLDGTVAELEDPFGDKLGTVRTGDRLKVWSRGRDGVDHGGKGEWKRDDQGADIVLEIAK